MLKFLFKAGLLQSTNILLNSSLQKCILVTLTEAVINYDLVSVSEADWNDAVISTMEVNYLVECGAACYDARCYAMKFDSESKICEIATIWVDEASSESTIKVYRRKEGNLEFSIEL